MKQIGKAFTYAEAQGMKYIPWAAAVRVAGVALHVERFGDRPFLPMLGGAVVAVRVGDPHHGQRVWLPVLDAKHRPIPSPTARDITDTLARARAKAVAMSTGYGLALYAGYDSAEAFCSAMKAEQIKEGTDLSKIPPLLEDKGGQGYVPWPAALAAAMLADPGFEWRVEMFDAPEAPGGRLPFLPLEGEAGYLVAVTVTTHLAPQGSHTEWLPIMGVEEVKTPRGVRRLDHQPLRNPGVNDWNRAVMRALTKAIALATGYGASVYAEELALPSPVEEDTPPPASGKAGELVGVIRAKLKQLGRREEDLISWLGVDASSLEEVPPEALQRAARALKIAA